MQTFWLSGAEWAAVLRIGLGLWLLASRLHKDKKTWFAGGGIAWAAGIAEKHRLPVVRRCFDQVVRPRPRPVTRIVVDAELALGLARVLGFLTPIGLVGGLLLDLLSFVQMVHDRTEQGQNLMVALISVVAFMAVAWQAWSLDRLLGLFQR